MKQTRLLEIIREEIAGALNEAGLGDQIATLQKQKDAVEKQKAPLTKKEADLSKKIADLEKKEADAEVKAGAQLEEEQLNEIEQLAEMASMVQLKNQLEKQGKSDELEAVRAAEQATINKLKDNPEFSGEGKNIRLKGYVKNLKKELKDAHGIDLQVLLSQVAAQAEKAGEDFKDDIATNTIEKNAAAQVLGTEKSKPGPQSSNTPKAEKPAKAEKAPKAKAAMAPKAEPMDDVDDEGNKIEIDTTIKTPTGDKTIEDKLKSVIAAKKTKLKAAKKGSPEFEKELAALTQFLNGKEISKYIKKKSVEGSNPYLISNILKDIE